MQKYSVSTRVLHWGVSALVILMLIVGLYMSRLPGDAPMKWDLYSLHKSFGIVALFVVLLRLLNRVLSITPERLKGVSNFDYYLSVSVVFLLYCLMLIVPLSGYLMSTLGGYPVYCFGILLPELPPNARLGEFACLVHKYGNYTFITLICLHFAGTIKHIIVDKLNVLRRII